MSMAASDRTFSNGYAHVKGDITQPLLNFTIGQLLQETAAQYPDRLAAVFCEEGVRWTWSQFQAEVLRLSSGLQILGLQRGDRLGIWSPNRSEWLLIQFATAQIGVILVTINPAYLAAELEYAIAKTGLKVLVAARRFKNSDYLQILDKVLPVRQDKGGRLPDSRFPQLEHIVSLGDTPLTGMMPFKDLVSSAHPQAKLPADLDPHDPINIQFTSGTTGSPKGATLTHHNIVNNGWFVARAMKFTHNDLLCIPVPLYHCFGLVLSVLACVSTGAAMVFPGEIFDPAATLRAVSQERCTALHGVPTMFIAQLALPDFDDHDLRSLRTGMMAGAPCPVEAMRNVISRMNMSEITIGYGMTETSPVSFQSETGDPLEKRVSTVGRVMPHLEVKIINAQGDTVRLGEIGELCTKGYSVMRGYWEDEAKTREVVKDGWMHTGDLATIDDQGYCSITGRLKDMVIRGGENIYPREVEEFLFSLEQVQEAQVFGVPDAKYGEELCAWIILKDGAHLTADELRQRCSGKIAHFKIPRHIRFVTSLPLTVSGKPQKFVMSKAMAEELANSPRSTTTQQETTS
jgi:fatty-acyl-CoA synthase